MHNIRDYVNQQKKERSSRRAVIVAIDKKMSTGHQPRYLSILIQEVENLSEFIKELIRITSVERSIMASQLKYFEEFNDEILFYIHRQGILANRGSTLQQIT